MNDEKLLEESETHALNEYFSVKLPSGKLLVTTRHGGFEILDEKEYELLYRGIFQKDPELLEKLNRVGIVLTKGNVTAVINSTKNYFSFLFLPMSYLVNISNECNLGCTYCHANASPKKSATMSSELLEATSRFITSAPSNEFYIEFQGGEALAKFGLVKEFVEKIRQGSSAHGKKIISINIVTNMTLMTEEIAQFILENNIGFCSSLDGPKELHDTNRRYADGRGTYETATKWISYFLKHGKTINLLPTITSYSLKFGAKSIVDEYLRYGCNKVMFRPVFHIGRAKRNARLHLEPEEFVAFWKEGIEYMKSLSENGTVVYDPLIQAMLRSIFGFPGSYMCMRRPCGAGITQLSISPDGKIFPCDLAKTMPELAMGNVNEKYLDVAARILPFAARTNESQPLCDTCVFGAYCGACLARSYAAFKDEVSRTPQDFDCKVNRAILTYLFDKMQDEKYRAVFELWAKQKR